MYIHSFILTFSSSGGEKKVDVDANSLHKKPLKSEIQKIITDVSSGNPDCEFQSIKYTGTVLQN